MKLYVVCLGDCEGMEIKAICKTKQIAERELFKVRDELIKEWEENIEFWKKIDAFDAFKRLEHFLANELVPPDEIKIPEPTDALKVQSHGFNEMSFRKEKTNERRK